MYSSSLPFERGGTLYERTPDYTPANTDLGMVVVVPDTRNNTQRPVRLRKVLNASSATITSPAGKPVRYTQGAYGLTIAGVAENISDADFAGYIDEARTLSIASNDVFWIREAGPHDCHGDTNDLLPAVSDYAKNRFGTVKIEYDFQNGATLPVWMDEIPTGSPTHTVVDIAGGAMNFAHAVNTDNAVGGFGGENESFLFAANQPIIFEARVRTNFDGGTTSNFAFGVINAVSTTNPILDAGTLATSFSGVLIYKIEADAKWRAVHSVGATQSIDTDCGTVATATWYILKIEWIPGATTGVAKFYIDGVLVHTSSAIAFASATEMEVCAICKSGSGSDDCSFDIDWLNLHQIRAAS